MMPVEIGRDISEFEVGMQRSTTRTFTQDDINQFAEITGDHNYFHVNAEAAAQSIFKRQIAQGLLVASMATHMGGVVFPGPGYIAFEMNSRFLKPVYPGDTITCTIEITRVDREKVWLEMTATWVNQDGVVVAEGTSSGRPTKVSYEPEA